MIHAGAWLYVGPQMLPTIAAEAERLTAYGWRTLNVDYRAGRLALRDVRRWFDWARATYAGPICAFGESAGAQLALMLASRRPVDCVIGHGVITDLRRIHGSPEAAALRRWIAFSFGRQLARNSPVEHPARPGTRVLLASGAADPLAPCRHLRAYRAVRPDASIHCLPAGPEHFIHTAVTAASLAKLHMREQALLKTIAPWKRFRKSAGAPLGASR